MIFRASAGDRPGGKASVPSNCQCGKSVANSSSLSLRELVDEARHGVPARQSNTSLPGRRLVPLRILVKQWHMRQSADQANWSVGSELLAPEVTAGALRTLTAEKAFENDPLLGHNPNPNIWTILTPAEATMAGSTSIRGSPTMPLYLAATELGGFAWEKVGKIWYQTLLALDRTAISRRQQR